MLHLVLQKSFTATVLGFEIAEALTKEERCHHVGKGHGRSQTGGGDAEEGPAAQEKNDQQPVNISATPPDLSLALFLITPPNICNWADLRAM